MLFQNKQILYIIHHSFSSLTLAFSSGSIGSTASTGSTGSTSSFISSLTGFAPLSWLNFVASIPLTAFSNAFSSSKYRGKLLGFRCTKISLKCARLFKSSLYTLIPFYSLTRTGANKMPCVAGLSIYSAIFPTVSSNRSTPSLKVDTRLSTCSSSSGNLSSEKACDMNCSYC